MSIETVIQGTLAGDGLVPVVADRIENDATLWCPAMVVGDRDREVRNLVRKIVGPVEWIDDPQVFGIDIGRLFFFAENHMPRQGLSNQAGDGAFGFDIRVRNQARILLAPEFDALVEVTSDDLASCPGGAAGDLKLTHM